MKLTRYQVHPSCPTSGRPARAAGVETLLPRRSNAGVETLLPRWSKAGHLLLAAVLSVSLADVATALDPGDIVVGQGETLLRIDPVTGDRSVLTGTGVGTGPALDLPVQIAFDVDGALIVADFDLQALVRVDPITGDRTIVASPSVGSGLPFRPFAVDRPVLEDYLAIEANGPSLVFVDPATGDRTIVSSSGVGGGPPLSVPRAIRVRGPGNKVFVTNGGVGSLIEVDYVTGQRTTISGPGVGTGPLLVTPRGLGLDADGDFFVADGGLDAIVRIDGTTGDRSIVSDAGTGSGPLFGLPYDLRGEVGGSVVVVDLDLFAVVRVDLSTGDRTVVSDGVTGSGPALASPRSIAVTPTPRLIEGFEGLTPGFPPAGLPIAGNVIVETVPDAPEGTQVLTLSTGPGANGLGPQGQDITVDGNVETDRAQIFFAFEREPTDPPFVQLEVAVLTGESPTPGVGRADPVTIQLDDFQPPYLFAQSVHFDNGTHVALSGFTGGPRVGLDGSSYDEGQVGYAKLKLAVDIGAHFFFFDVADEQGDLGDTAWRIDDIRMVPEPAALPALAAGCALLLGLARRRARAERAA